MEHLVKAFTDYMTKLGYAWYSVHRRHAYHLKEYISYLKAQGITVITDTQVHHILSYKSYLENRENKTVGGKLQMKTIYDQMRSLELFYDYLQLEGIISYNPRSELSFKAPPRRPRRIFATESEIHQLYNSCKDDKERAVLSLNYGCGLRAMELELLQLPDLYLDDGYLIVKRGKGNKRRSVPMSIGVIRDVRNYLRYDRPRLTGEKRYDRTAKSVMLNEIGGTMKEWTYNHTLQRIAKRTENQSLISKRITTHIMRHSIATHLLNRGLDIYQVRAFLGHVLLSTTQIYTHINNDQVLQL